MIPFSNACEILEMRRPAVTVRNVDSLSASFLPIQPLDTVSSRTTDPRLRQDCYDGGGASMHRPVNSTTASMNH